MRNWGTIVTGFYVVVVAALSPVFCLVAVNNGADLWFKVFNIDLVDAAIWAGWTALLAGGPFILLFVSVDSSRVRLRPRRTILVSAVAAGLALSLLVLAAVASVVAAIIGENGDWWFAVLTMLTIWLGFLVLWTLTLWSMGDRLFNPATRVYRWLIKGSVLELLITVPSHVIVRARHDCCAPGVTGMGIATGLAILLMSIGPGVLFLYRARMRRISDPSARGGGEINGSSAASQRHQTAAQDRG